MVLDALSVRALPPQAGSPVILMVSGGSDSTALLVRAVRGTLDLADGFGPQRVDPARLAALHVNHGIRGAASDGDEAFVRELCAELGVPVRVARVDVPALMRAASDARGRNLEEVARTERYRAAWELACELSAAADVPVGTARICVAHTADDRAETFVMRAMGGAGLSGLTGMRPSCGIVVRPLLGATRDDLRALLGAWGVGWREDATNDEDVALRSYVRHHVLPPMRERNPALSATMGRMLDVLAEEDGLLARLADDVLARALRGEDAPGATLPTLLTGDALRLDAGVLAGAEPALARRALLRGLGLLLGEDGLRRARLEGRHVETLLGLVRAGRGSATLPLAIDARIMCGKLRVGRPGSASGAASGAGEPPLPVHLPVPGILNWAGTRIEASLVAVPAGADVAQFARAQAAELAEALGIPVRGHVAVLDAERAGLALPAGSVSPSRTCDPAALPDDRVLTAGALLVRAPHPGERVRPLGLRGHTKLVADLLMEARIPAARRPSWPLVCAAPAADGPDPASAPATAGSKPAQTGHVSCGGDDGGVVWVAGIRPDERAAYHTGTRVLLRLTAVTSD